MFRYPMFKISIVESMDKLFESIKPAKIPPEWEEHVSELSLSLYKWLHEANAKYDLLTTEFLKVTSQGSTSNEGK